MTQLRVRNFEMPGWVVEHAAELRGADGKVLQALFAYGKQVGGNYGERRSRLEVSSDEMAKLSGVTPSTYHMSRDRLEELGFIKVHGKTPKRENTLQVISSPYDLYASEGFAPAPQDPLAHLRSSDTEDESFGVELSENRRPNGTAYPDTQGDSNAVHAHASRDTGDPVTQGDTYGAQLSENRRPTSPKIGDLPLRKSESTSPKIGEHRVHALRKSETSSRAGTGWSGGGVSDHFSSDSLEVQDLTPTTTTTRETALRFSETARALRDLGVRDPRGVIREFGVEQAEAAAEHTYIAIDRGRRGLGRPVGNYGAYVVGILQRAKQAGMPVESPHREPEELTLPNVHDQQRRYREVARELFDKQPRDLSKEEEQVVRRRVFGLGDAS